MHSCVCRQPLSAGWVGGKVRLKLLDHALCCTLVQRLGGHCSVAGARPAGVALQPARDVDVQL